MAKVQNISEIHPTLGFTEFDVLEKYRKSFNESELDGHPRGGIRRGGCGYGHSGRNAHDSARRPRRLEIGRAHV